MSQKAREASGGFVIALVVVTLIFLVFMCDLCKEESDKDNMGMEKVGTGHSYLNFFHV